MIDETYVEFAPDINEITAVSLTREFTNLMIPVSYTHLDVYKRQVCGVLSVIVSIISFTHPVLTMISAGYMIAFSVLMQGINMIAVSYTHLLRL